MLDRVFASRHTVPHILEAFRRVRDFTGEINSALSFSLRVRRKARATSLSESAGERKEGRISHQEFVIMQDCYHKNAFTVI